MSEQNGLQVQRSTRLYSTLEYIGVTEERRKILCDNARKKEILLNINERVLQRKTRSFYIFGSSGEGTTTDGLESDNDFLVCLEHVKIKEKVDDGLKSHLLMIRDDNTNPGYVKLQPVIDGEPQIDKVKILWLRHDFRRLFSEDEKGRCVVLNSSFLNEISPLAVWNGPAITERSDGAYKDADYVNTKRYPHIPRFAREWIDRNRRYGWPSSECLHEMEKQGCFLVRKGHPNSSEKGLEWRVSFSLQERRLVESLNPTQYKTYILLKMIKKDLIESVIGKSISSYHLKTSLLYTIETTEQTNWVSSKLIECIEKCLQKLLIWLQNENCPNYFIPEENMFDSLDSETMDRAANCISIILKSQLKGSFIPAIKCDNIGNYFQNPSLTENSKKSKEIVYFVINSIINDQRVQFLCLLTIFRKFNSMETLDLYKYLLNTLDEIETIGPVAGHDTETVQNAVAKTRCLLYLHSAICIACFEPLATESFEYYINKADGFDLMSAMLVKATVTLKFCNTEECGRILTKCETVLGPTNVSSCGCHMCYNPVPKSMFNGFQSSDQSLDQMVNHIPASCLMFHPSEANILPTALVYEMYRSVFTSAIPRKERTEDWFDWIAIDSKIYLYLLKYLLDRRTIDDYHKHFFNLILLLDSLQQDFCPGHIETGYNLAGWIFVQENKPDIAMKCFIKSWKMRPHHNAAKWHVLCLLHDIVNEA